MEEERIMAPGLENGEEERLEKSLRPSNLEEYIGQDKVKENMKIYIESAKKRGEPLDHCLFYGPPGLGKTTISTIIANEMHSNIKITSGPAIEKPGDLASLLTNLSEFDVLFIDEIHRLSKSVEEILYPALEDFTLDIVIGKGPSAKSIRLDLPKFTLIGATTKAGSLTTPLRDRFGIVHRLELYSVEDLTTIVKRSSKILDMKIEEDAAKEIARRSRGTPRIANRLLKRVRDYAIVLGDGDITLEIAKHALNKLEIDELGLDEIDRKLLETMIVQYAGRPVGIEALAVTIGEEIDTIEDVYEPYLIQIGFIARTLRGRKPLPKAYEHLGYNFDGTDNTKRRRTNIILKEGRNKVKLLLHTCCAPCSVYCIDTLRKEGIEPTLYWYNPNIHPYKEYEARRDCLKEYAKLINVEFIIEDEYGLDEFCKNVSNNLDTRCVNYCYPVRLRKTFEYAKENGYDAVSTTLLYSIYQKHDFIKKYMEDLSKEYGIEFLYRDFRYGFWEGHDKAKELGLYMQKYCGCVFSEQQIFLTHTNEKPKLPDGFEFLPVTRTIVIRKEKEDKEKYEGIFLPLIQNEDLLRKYLREGDVFVLSYKDDMACVAIVNKVDDETMEIKNIATIDKYKGQDYESKMIKYLSDNYKTKYKKMLIGTTENNIPFYVKQGFDKYEKTIKNYFVDMADEEIRDGDLQCIDMYYYSKDLSKKI